MQQALNRFSEALPEAASLLRGQLAAISLSRAAVASVVAALGLWLISLPAIELRALNDLGLVSVLPPSYYGALVMVAMSLVLALRMQPVSQLLCTGIVLTIVTILYATVPVLTEVMSFPTAWLHAGFIDAIARTGELFPHRDARFDWPGFFAFGAFVTRVAGIDNAADVGAWIPVLLNVLYLPPLLVIARSLTGDLRLRWLAVATFYITNWVGQDYLSPQGLNILLYLTIFAIVLSVFSSSSPHAFVGWLRRHGVQHVDGDEAEDRDDPKVTDESGRGRTRAGLIVALSLIIFVMASSHQLTPFAAIGSATLLVVFGRTSIRSLPLIMIVIVGTWISYMTVTYLAGHIEGILRDVGQPDDIATATVVRRVRGSADHQVVVLFRLGFTLAVWLVASVGMIRRLRSGRLDLTVLLMAAAPFLLLGLQAYGGEMLLRVYLFSMPFVAFLAAAAFYPSPGPRPLRHGLLLGMTVVLVMAGFIVARYGNARMDIMNAREAEAAEAVYMLAEPDSLIAVASNSTPLRNKNWDQYRYAIVRDELLAGDVDNLVATMQAREAEERFLFLTRSQGAYLEILLGLDPAYWEDLLNELRAAPEFRRVYENADALVLQLLDAEEVAAP